MPRFGEQIAPCFEYSATIAIFTLHRRRLVEQTDFTLQSREAIDRVRLLVDQQVDVLICGGIQAAVERLIRARGIQVHSWIEGQVEDLLGRFAENNYTFDSAPIESKADGPPRTPKGGRDKR